MPAAIKQPLKAGADVGDLFRAADGRNVFLTFALVASLFLLWGFCSGMVDILNRHFQDSLHINQAQSGLVQSANYIAYFLMAIPAGLLARKWGYRLGLVAGLGLFAAGAFWLIPATRMGSYGALLTGLFVVATGMACLETIANPYTTLLGGPESSATRLNIAQTFNGLGRMLGPLVGGQFIFGGAGGQAAPALYVPYLGAGIAAVVLMAVLVLARAPDWRAGAEDRMEAGNGGGQRWWRRGHFIFGVAAQFFYLAAQAGIFSFFVNYVLENDPGVTARRASTWLGAVGLGLFLGGRLCGSAVIGRLKPQRVLAVCAAISAGLMAVAVGGGKPGLGALFASFFFMSIMFPTIFALGIRDLGNHTKLGSSIIVMAMAGGAVAPPFMGHLADLYSVRAGLLAPLVCFVFIAIYGAIWPRLEARDRGGKTWQ